MGYYEKLGKILSEKLEAGEDPFARFAAKKKENATPESGRKGSIDSTKAKIKKRVRAVSVPPELAEDFLVLGLKPGEGEEECKSAWKLLLKMHHPDKHQGSEDEKKAAEQATINITRSYRRLERWFATGEVLKE